MIMTAISCLVCGRWECECEGIMAMYHGSLDQQRHSPLFLLPSWAILMGILPVESSLQGREQVERPVTVQCD